MHMDFSFPTQPGIPPRMSSIYRRHEKEEIRMYCAAAGYWYCASKNLLARHKRPSLGKIIYSTDGVDVVRFGALGSIASGNVTGTASALDIQISKLDALRVRRWWDHYYQVLEWEGGRVRDEYKKMNISEQVEYHHPHRSVFSDLPSSHILLILYNGRLFHFCFYLCRSRRQVYHSEDREGTAGMTNQTSETTQSTKTSGSNFSMFVTRLALIYSQVPRGFGYFWDEA
ncbi:hypothetical protein AG1IA_08851 [Rhizoctonia solani AG-1 IA]|uniref:Uncharacterized protein n=1 Tax=Thanatephorus cucumeris (strain AG1-IA) TaxID=983506 RepID=L8WL91_THACA|nr:hypothetical protein AG1IA_08851 [Rhizoctonia solani AG-1 IA]